MNADKTANGKQKRRSLDEILVALGERIRSERSQRGFSQEGFAEDCALHRTAVGLLERGKSIPKLDTLLIISEHLGISPSELLQGLKY